MTIKIKVYDCLNKDICYIREKVFMAEQGFQREFDEIDNHCHYVVLYVDNKPAATCRYFKEDAKWYIGRVCTIKDYRGHHFGTMVMQEAEKQLDHRTDRLYLEAQVRAAHFYETLGYQKTDQYHDDEGVPHVLMYKELNRG